MANVDLKALSDEALIHHELAMERTYVLKRFAHRTNQLDDTSSLKVVRREIARTRTEERLRERAQSVAKDSLRTSHRHTFKPGKVGAVGAVASASSGFLSGIASKFGIGGDSDDSAADGEASDAEENS
jgi:ribosomal protein L29